MPIADYPITIDGNNFLIKDNSLIQQFPPSLPTRIRTTPSPNFDDLTVWECIGMNSFMGGLGQKKFTDEEMFFDNMGTCPYEDEELKLSYSANLWKDFGGSGLMVEEDYTNSRVIRDDADYDDKWWFANWYGYWDAAHYFGSCLIWDYDGSTVTPHRGDGGVGVVGTSAAAADGTIILASNSGITSGDYCLVCTSNNSGWEVVYVTDVTGLTLTVTRACDLTWDWTGVGKTYTYPALDIPVKSCLYELSWTEPPNMGGGVASMCVYDNKLYFGTLCGAVFMYHGDYNMWFVQPYPPGGGSPYTAPDEVAPWTPPTPPTSVDAVIDSMCVFRDKLFCAVGAKLYQYDSTVASGQNPWGADMLQKVMASYALNGMVVYNYSIYFCSWLGKDRTATLFKYDGTSVYPVYSFDSVTEIRCMRVYDGKIFIGLGRYNYSQTQSVGQLWSYDGMTMRKHFSRPRNDKQDGTVNTIMAMKVVNDKLYFSDNYTTGIYVYDATYDAVHRANLCETWYGATSGDYVEGIFNWGDIMYISVASKGILSVSTSAFSTGGTAGQYGGFKYPYLKTSMLGNNFPNLEKLFYRITFWHSPAVTGQKFHLYMSRNGMQSYSADHVITPTSGTTSTSYIFMEEGKVNAAPTSAGNFSGVATSGYGIKAVDFSLVVGLETPSATTQFTVYGFVIEYLPIQAREALRFRIGAVDHMKLPSGGYDPRTGVEKLRQLEATYLERRPVMVYHPLLADGVGKVMTISDFKAILPDANPSGFERTNTYHTLESEAIIELTEA